LSESGEKYANIKHRLQTKTVLNKYVVDFEIRGQQEMDFSTEGSVIMDYVPEAVWPETNVKTY